MRIVLSIAAPLLGGLALAAQVKDARPLQVGTFRPVSEQVLRNPPPEDWLNWRRTDNNWGYSTLTEITRQNVQQLQLSWAMEDRAQQATPLVHDGVVAPPLLV